MSRELLKAALEAAVPLWIAQLQGRSVEYLLERARVCGQHVAEHGDVIQFMEKGKTAEAFNRLAEGLACAALLVDGGVRVLDLHFEARRPR